MDAAVVWALVGTLVTALVAAFTAILNSGAYSRRGRDRRSIEGEVRILAGMVQGSDVREKLVAHIDKRVARHLWNYWEEG